MIIFPLPKIYLDTNHLINISRVNIGASLGSAEKYREDYIYINKCIQEAKCAIVFNLSSPLEWVEGNATEQTARQIASIFDKAECIYQAAADTIIYAVETLKECKRIEPSISFPEILELQYLERGSYYTSAEAIIQQHVPSYSFGTIKKPNFPKNVPVMSIKDHAIEALRWSKKNPDICEERIKGYNETLQKDFSLAGDNFKGLSKREIIGWLKRFIQIDKILEEVASPRTNIDDLLNKIDISKCPAINLNIRIRENLIRNKCKPEDNDCDDFIYLPIIPYADISLIEKDMSDRILQVDQSMKTKLFRKPSDAANAIRKFFKQ